MINVPFKLKFAPSRFLFQFICLIVQCFNTVSNDCPEQRKILDYNDAYVNLHEFKLSSILSNT